MFALVSASPIDPLTANYGSASLAKMSPEKAEALSQLWSKDSPILDRYISWLSSLVHGDFGTSLKYNAPVAEVIAARAANSVLLMAIAWALSGIFGFALGVVAGVNRGSKIDSAVKTYCFILAASPTFWVALIMLMIFSVALGWFPIGFSADIGRLSQDVTIGEAASHIVLPAITLSIVGIANVALHTREKTIDVMNAPYVRFALARGMTRKQALIHHGLRNLALPAITIQFAQVAEIFGGSVLVEQVFSYPGLGQAAVAAGIGGDAALLAAIALVSAAIVFGGNFFANILYMVIDPRTKVLP